MSACACPLSGQALLAQPDQHLFSAPAAGRRRLLLAQSCIRYGLVQLICALRLLMPDSALVLSTRESAALRDHLLPLGITQISAEFQHRARRLRPEEEANQQFAIDDDRDAEEICAMLRAKGYDPVFKDWDRAFLEGTNE
ncbi:MAG: hypothetical protein R2864_06790 [Syntrophotaleaceae bacterium]